MKILVIGNGFDLEHGLPTKYKDFLDFMQGIKLLSSKANIIDKQSFIEELETITKHEVDENIKEYLTQEKFLDSVLMKEWKEEAISKELIEYTNNNFWISFFLENVQYENKGWIDFESEISEVIKTLDRTYKVKKRSFDIIRTLIIKSSEKNINYESEYIEIINKDLNKLIRSLEIYLEEFIRKIDIEYLAPDIKDTKFDKVLSFNYTNTYERLYGFNSNDIEYHYIHGKANITRSTDDNNMVLGVDEYLNDEAKNKELEFIAFKKYFQRIYKRTGNEYKKWILKMENIEYESTGEYDELGQFETQKIKNEIYIFGHSLDITDKDIIKELIECPNTEMTIFYYDKDVYAQQIANMVKIIGQDEVIKRVSGANPTIIFKQQKKRIERD